MRKYAEEFDKNNVRIVIVTFEAGYFVNQYKEETGLDWPLLVDTDKILYQGYGMFTASFWDIWGPKTWWVYAKEILKGQKLKLSKGDINQRGGDVLIDPGGIIRMHHVGIGPADRPAVSTVQQIIKGGVNHTRGDIMTTRKIEVFSAGCPLCTNTVELVNRMSCPSCDVTIVDMHDIKGATRAQELGVKSIPAVAINGKLADCCASRGPDEAVLQKAGLSQPIG